MHKITYLLLLIAAAFSMNFVYLSAEDSNDWQQDIFGGEGSSIEVTMSSEQTAVRPGEAFWIAIHFDFEKPWHCYWKNPGDAGMGPQIQWTLPSGFKVVDLSWPTPHRFEEEHQVGFGYDAPFVLLAKVQVPQNAKIGEKAAITADMRWVSCSNEMCMPGDDTKTIEISIANQSLVDPSLTVFHQARQDIPQELSETHAVQRDGMLAVHCPIKVSSDAQVEFFPEEAKVIDHRQNPVVLSREKGVVFALKAEGKNSNTHLQGVVVVQDAKGKKGYSIKAPFEGKGKNSELVAMLEAQVPPMKIIPPDDVNEVPFEGGVLLALVMAFVGGMILNLMPCVLPVISFKILSFVKMSGQSRSVTLRHGIAFSMGVLVSFWVLASLLLALQAYGRSAGWGFQLQEPIFVGILAAIMLVFGLSMFGVFELGAFFAAWVGTKHAAPVEKQESLLSSFFSGILATAVATPCTGPFLGSAVGYAVTLPPWQAMLIFTSLGLGMAFPYLLLAAFPNLLRFLPKPGAWMESFKQFMGFIMLGSVLWLVWVFGFQMGIGSQTELLIGLFLIALACWIYGRWSCAPHRSQRTRMLSLVLALIVIGFGGQCILSAGREAPGEIAMATEQSHHGGWENFDPERLKSLQEQGVPVFIDFTAKWCLICQANHLVLSTQDVTKEMMQLGVVRMKADWTKSDPAITAYLKKYGRNSVPLYLLFSGKEGEKPQILPQVLTREVVLQALKELPVPSAK